MLELGAKELLVLIRVHYRGTESDQARLDGLAQPLFQLNAWLPAQLNFCFRWIA